MKAREFLRLAGRLMRHPAAPYCEHGVRAEVQSICSKHRLRCELDGFGNLLVRLRTAARRRPLVLAAHLDHPGFALLPRAVGHRWRARFLGGVPDGYFRLGIRLRLMPGNVAARLGRRAGSAREFEIHAAATNQQPPRFGVWELPDFAFRQGRIHGRACDDLIGVACILATMIELKRRRSAVNVIGLISRAEEVGFHGALAACGTRVLPEKSLVVSLETSRELPGVKMGQGVILRVGDRTSIFDARATRFLREIAQGIKTMRKGFLFQSALMSGGTCEATAFQEFGFQTAAVCVALGNYHNCGPKNRIAAEYVSLGDVIGMVELLVAAAKQIPRYARLVGTLPSRLRKMRRQAEPALRRTARE